MHETWLEFMELQTEWEKISRNINWMYQKLIRIEYKQDVEICFLITRLFKIYRWNQI